MTGPVFTPLRIHVLLATLNHLAFNGIRITVTLYAAASQASPALIGLIAGSFGVVSAFTAVSMGRWVDRGGPRAPMMAASLWVAGGSALAGLAGHFDLSLLVLFLVCPVVGMFNSTFQIATQQTVGRYGQPSERPANFALQSLGLAVATFCGPLVAGVCIDHVGGYAITFLILAAIAFVPFIVIGSGRLHFPAAGPKAPVKADAPGGWRLLRSRELRKTYVIATLNNGVWSVTGFMIPIYGVQIGLSATAIGTLMSCLAAGVVGVRLLLPVLSRRFRTWTLVLAAQTLIAIGFAWMPFTSSYLLLVPAAVLIGMGLGIGGPMSTSLMYDASPEGKIAEVVGLRMTGANVCQTLVPLALGAVGAAVGVGPVFWTVGAIVFGDCLSNRDKLARRPGRDAEA